MRSSSTATTDPTGSKTGCFKAFLTLPLNRRAHGHKLFYYEHRLAPAQPYRAAILTQAPKRHQRTAPAAGTLGARMHQPPHRRHRAFAYSTAARFAFERPGMKTLRRKRTATRTSTAATKTNKREETRGSEQILQHLRTQQDTFPPSSPLPVAPQEWRRHSSFQPKLRISSGFCFPSPP